MTSPAKTQPQKGAGGEGIDHWDIATKMTQVDALKRELSRNTTTSRNTTENEDNTGLKDTSRNNTTSRNTTRKCASPDCNKEFIPKQWNHKYCSDECRAHGNGFESVEHVKRQVAKKKGG